VVKGKAFDVIVVGAGSVGVPVALALGEMGIKTLVLDGTPRRDRGRTKRPLEAFGRLTPNRPRSFPA
jgi:2-polyprenyl-6-methoxyphenol hydroxylase-like FAD-dependent oxidoreductase